MKLASETRVEGLMVSRVRRIAPPAELSVVVPAYNEEKRLGRSLQRICATLRSASVPFEVVVVDDGSTDGTADLARSFAEVYPEVRLVSYSPNRGKGHAVRRGLAASRGGWVLMCDADLSTPIEEVFRMLPFVKDGFDVVIGSRKMPGANVLVRQSRRREFLGRAFSLISRVTLVPGIRDFTCGFKLFRGDVAKELAGAQRLDGWSFDSEVLYIASCRGLRIKEVPVTWVDSPASKVRVLRDTFGSLAGLARIRLNAALGRYRR